MKKYLEGLPKKIRELVYLAKDLAAYRRMPAYLVGGFVRDLILGVRNFDLDIVVVGDGIKFAEYFARALKAKLIRHKRFGTATVVLKPGLKIDIATARSEIYPLPAHLPVVKPGSLEDDLFRRDFTINAMAISLAENDFGRLIDCYGGVGDLKNKTIRVLHALSFIDDPTRIIRAIRFEQRFGFKLDAGTLKLLKEAVRAKMLKIVEPQRLRDDLILVLKEAEPIKEIMRFKELTGFSFIDKHLVAGAKTIGLLRCADKEIKWFIRTHPRRRALDSWLIYFIALTDNLKSPAIKPLVQRFALKRGEEIRILSYKSAQLKIAPALKKKDINPSELFSCLEPLSYEVIILLKAKFGGACLRNNIDKFFLNLNGARISISGDDLRRLGLEPGPHYQKIFKSILNAKLDGKLRTRQDELRLVKNIIRRP
ncbi:MAG: hypothetical protein NT088_02520 [Candidatus Omnitrophica bacterium]|nr:hypothetical protein [Candidatus Omnitrophota bacterium]